MANSKAALQFLLLSAFCLNIAFSYKLVHYDPYALTGLMLQSQHLVAEPQTLVRMAKVIDGSQTPVYKDTAPIMPRHMEYVDLKAYESAVRDLITEVDKKDRAPHPRSDDLDPRPSRQVDVNVNVNPYVDVKVKKQGYPDGGVNEDDNGGTIDAEGGVPPVGGGHGFILKPYKPLNLGIDIPGIFNLQIFRDHNGRRRIGIGVLPGWTGIQVGHTTNNPGTQVGVQVGAPIPPGTQDGVVVGPPKHPGTQVGVVVGPPTHPGTQVGVVVGPPTHPGAHDEVIVGPPKHPGAHDEVIVEPPSHPGAQVGVRVGPPKHPGTQVGVIVGPPKHPGTQVGVEVGSPSFRAFHYYK